MNTYHDIKSKPRYGIEDAVDFFRERELKPLMLPSSCPWCGKEEGAMEIIQFDVEERIELRIGAYRIARCKHCGATAVAFAKMARRKEIARPDEEYKKWVQENFGGFQSGNKP